MGGDFSLQNDIKQITNINYVHNNDSEKMLTVANALPF